jgi:UDP-N-acetylmuramate dehydrogenase
VTALSSWPCAALANAPLAARTTMRIGGAAAWLLEPATPEEFRRAWLAALERGAEPRVLGGGANLLIEEGDHGVVITPDRMRRVFRPGAAQTPEEDAAAREHGDPREPKLVAWAGAGMPGLCRTARDSGLAGLAGLVGIPGHLGGGVAMNAGGRWGVTWDVVESVHVLSPEGVELTLPRAECTPTYRSGGLGRNVVLGAVLALAPGERTEIAAEMRDYLAQKSAAQPVQEHSSGCIFQNPDPERSDGRSAGMLIEQCGGKGLSRGDAIVSPKHGNFIVNRGRARAADVLGLIDDVRALVRERAGIELATEVRVWRAESGPRA